jgi:hypothetical protein
MAKLISKEIPKPVEITYTIELTETELHVILTLYGRTKYTDYCSHHEKGLCRIKDLKKVDIDSYQNLYEELVSTVRRSD